MGTIIFNRLSLKLLLIFTVLVNFSAILLPLLRNDDPVLYALIARHIVLSNNWTNLVFQQHDWLDKPHFPFWCAALSFRLFGITSFAYILPGFIFHLIGAYYTYRLTAKLYANTDITLIAVIVYLSSLHLMLSSIDVRAEAYLLGEIMPACFYLYNYYHCDKITWLNLLLGALFTALAIMTKGLFVVIVVVGGIVAIAFYQRQVTQLLSLKWLLLVILTLLFITPELYALYVQFDAHPDKYIFGYSHVSGIKWFFWDSQVGRFFNHTYIKANYTQHWHYIFFLHTFLWVFLPWSLLFIYSLVKQIAAYKSLNTKQQIATWYFFGSFIPMFVLFSLSSFQLDYYTNILMPFAAMFCADCIYSVTVLSDRAMDSRFTLFGNKIFNLDLLQTIVTIVLLAIVIIGSSLLWQKAGMLISISGITGLFVIFGLIARKDRMRFCVIYPVLAINCLFIGIIQVNRLYMHYDLGYVADNYLAKMVHLPVVDYQDNSLTLEFYSHGPYVAVTDVRELKAIKQPYYLVVRTKTWNQQLQQLHSGNYQILLQVSAGNIVDVAKTLLLQKRLAQNLSNYLVVLIK